MFPYVWFLIICIENSNHFAISTSDVSIVVFIYLFFGGRGR